MKILFISRAYSNSSGGMERFSYDLINAASLNSKLSVKKIIHSGSRKTSPLFVFLIIPKVIFSARGFDYIHLGDPMLSIVGWLIKIIYRKKIMVTVHGLDAAYPNTLYQIYLRLFFRSFDYYLPISKAVKKELAKHSVGGRVTVINPGISNDYYDPSISRLELDKIISKHSFRKISPSNVFLLTTGRLVKRKGHAWFITNVFPELPSNVHYAIAGDGPEKENIIKAVKEYNLQDRVHLLGRVSDADLKILYNTVDAFVQPNIKVAGDMEGFGLVLLEAALCNKKVFAAELEGMIDAIDPKYNGTLLAAENKDMWIDTITSFVGAPSQNKGARTFTLGNYSWQFYISKLIDIVS